MGIKLKNLIRTSSSPELKDPQKNRTVKSLKTEDIGVVYQPIADLNTGQLFAQEALVRCKVDAFADPATLFDQAVVENSCGLLGRTIREVIFADEMYTRLFVNIHPAELSSCWLVRPDDPICFHRQEVYIEITESAVIEYYDLCINVLKEVCFRNNAHLVIDDLGAGYSNLTRLVELYPSVVKLDLTLARHLDKNKRKQILVKHLVDLCVELNAKVVAEGIETVDELKAIQDTGAHYGQGFLLGHPSFPPPPVIWPL